MVKLIYDVCGEYGDALVTTYVHEPNTGWQGSGAAEFTFCNCP